jgi:hypothetical protein
MSNFVGIEEHLDDLKGNKLYEVVVHCTGCDAGAVIYVTNKLDEAKEIAKQGEVIIKDPETGEMHNYETAVLAVKRKPIWVTKQNIDMSDLEGLS